MKYGKWTFWQKVKRSPLTIIILVIVLGVLARATWAIHKKADLSADKLSRARLEMAKLEERRGDLAAKVDFLSTDQGIESEMRTKYRAAKEGELVAVIVDDQSREEMVSSTSAASTSETWFAKFLDVLGL